MCHAVYVPILICCTQISEGKVDSLPVNFFLNNLLSMVSLHGDSGSSNLECDNCDSGDPAVKRCTNCCHFLCEFCTQAHQRGRSTSSHGLVSLEEAKKMGSVAVTKPSFCKEHEGELLKLFCETCDEAICRDCTIVKHREHKYTFVKDAFAKNKESVVKILSETKRKALSLKEAIDGVSEMKRSVESHAEQTVREVINCFQKLTACLNSRCEELLHGIQELKTAKQKSLEIQQEELETALGGVQSSVEFTEKALENGSEVEILNMRKQMSSRLQDLNSAKWQLEPCAHDIFKFQDDDQLQHAITNFGKVSDVVTHAGTSTVTMGHGLEGVMYNTLCGQSVDFTVTAKERNGRKRQEGGDTCEVKIYIQPGYLVFNDSPKDCGNGKYTFCFTPNNGHMKYQLSVKLNGCHVKGSPFLWFSDDWHLCSENCGKQGKYFGYSQLDRDAMMAPYKIMQEPQSQMHRAVNVAGGWSYCDVRSPEDLYSFRTSTVPQPMSGRQLTVLGFCSFGSGKHSWKVQISGDVSNAFAFGISAQRPCEDKWTWMSSIKHQPSSYSQQSSITNCADSDVIEFYLDLDNRILTMYNQRTKESDTWRKVKGTVCPMFKMCVHGQAVFLVS